MILVSVLALALQIGDPNGSRTTQSSGDYQNQLRDKAAEQKLPGKPIFLKTPTQEDIDAAYPRDALAKKIAGQAVVKCKIDKDGAFTACEVLSETPGRAGFGDAALKVSKVFKLDTKDTNGASVVGVGLTIPMKFAVP